MQDVDLAIRTATIASSRAPSATAEFAWDRSRLAASWFRLDQSQLDSGALLTLVPYDEGVEPEEIIAAANQFTYSDESGSLISAEGLEEMRGDVNQSIVSEADLVFDNLADRYTPRPDKNLLSNPGFESDLTDWTMQSGSGSAAQNVGQDTGVVSGTKATMLSNPNRVAEVFLYHSDVGVVSGIDYTTSLWARGQGTLDLRVISMGSGSQQVASGVGLFPLSSGTFQRFSLTVTPHVNSDRLRVRFMNTEGNAIVDNVQLEKSNLMTSYEEDFIGDFILPRRPVKVQIKMLDPTVGSGGDVPRFIGLTETFDPDLKDGRMWVHAYDFATELMSKKVATITTGLGMYQNLRTDQLIRELGYMGGLTNSEMSLETGLQRLPFAWFRDGSVWWYMSQVAEAEGGRVFFDETGTLGFWNREHLDVGSGSRFTFTMRDWITDLDYRIDKDVIKNHIVVKSLAREVQSKQPVWRLDAPVQVLSGETKTIWANINDEEGRDLPMPSIDTPSASGVGDVVVAGTSFFRANSETDETGIDLAHNFWLKTFDKFATAAKMVFNNQGQRDGYVAAIELWGTPAAVKKEINVEVEDATSINIFGRQTLQVENDMISSEEVALNIARQRIFDLKDPTDRVLMTVIGVPYLQIGDRVTVQTDYNGTLKDLYVVRNRWELQEDNDFLQHLELQGKPVASYFILDQSQLDSKDVLRA